MRVVHSCSPVVAAFFVLLQSIAADAQLCQHWTPAVRVGELPPQLQEASGIAASRAHPGRLYHINDSGDAGRFYVTSVDGTGLQIVQIAGFRPIDTEAMSLGPCPARASHSCLYIADIGDNNRRRKTIEIVAVDEMGAFPQAVKPAARLTLRYPDGPHDAESMAVHPDGTLFILTKERPARLFKAGLHTAQPTLEAVTALDVGHPPTDMAISDDGKRLIVLTYQDAVEFAMDFKAQNRIAIQFLQQQETIAYLPGSGSFVYTTERTIGGFVQPIMKVDCVPRPSPVNSLAEEKQ